MSRDRSTPLLDVSDLVVQYGAFRALDGISFSLLPGATLAIVGESGCGKSTVAKALVRLLRPTSGSIMLDGQDIAQMPERRFRPLRSKIQMVFQDPYGSLNPQMSAQEIVCEPMRLTGAITRSERRNEARRLLDQVGLPESALDRRPSEFSGGQRQRLAIARALASKPEVMILDESTSALDVSVQAQVLELLRDIQRETGIAYLMISHNLGVVREISQDIVVMSKGRIVESGPTERVLSAPTNAYTRTLRAAALDPMTMTGIKPRWVVSRLNPAPAAGDRPKETA